MTDFYAGKRVAVTGAASGIGLAAVEALLARSASVAMIDYDGAALEAQAAALRGPGQNVFSYALDVTDRAGWKDVRDRILADLGGVDILFNNAGIMAMGWDCDEIPPNIWDKIIAVNLTGVQNGVQALVPVMRRQGTGGHIINTASMSALRCPPRNGVYAAAKAGVVALSEVMRQELAGTGIGVTVLAPGTIRTPLFQNSEPQIAEEAGPGERRGNVDLLDYPGTQSAADLAEHLLDGVARGDAYVVTHPGERGRVTAQQQLVQDAFDRLAPA